MWSRWLDGWTKVCGRLGRLLGEGPTLAAQNGVRNTMCAALDWQAQDLSAVLPYCDYDNGLFINHQSVGFVLALSVYPGADETVVSGLAELLKTKLSPALMCQCWLVKDHNLDAALMEAFGPYFEGGTALSEMGKQALWFHQKAAAQGYDEEGHHLSRLSLYCAVYRPAGREAYGQMQTLCGQWMDELQVLGCRSRVLAPKELQALTQHLMGHPKVGDTPGWVASGSLLTAQDDQVVVKVPAATLHQRLAVHLTLADLPRQFALWQTPDLYANLYQPTRAIGCPFVIHLTFQAISETKAREMASQKAQWLVRNNNAIQQMMNPFLKEETAQWQAVSEAVNQGRSRLFHAVYTLTLWTAREHKARHVAQAIRNYRDLGFRLTPALCQQWLCQLMLLPFMPIGEFWQCVKRLKLHRTLTEDNIANLLPVVGDNGSASQGLPAPTFRHQWAVIDTFGALENYNYTISGTSGSGKSNLAQAQIIAGLASGERCFIVDIGDSYKHLCQRMGGVYVDASTVCLNPFTLFDGDGVCEMAGQTVDNIEQIRDLLAMMASPNEALSGVQTACLLDAVRESWRKHGRESSIDTVVLALKAHAHDSRIADLVWLLKAYTSEGMYGPLFNGKTPAFHQAPMVVFELGGFSDRPSLLPIVLFAMIVLIQGQCYHSARASHKRCVIDEAWRFIKDCTNPIAARFINQGFRTGRKYNAGFGVIVQGEGDLLASELGQTIQDSAAMRFVLRQANLDSLTQRYPKRFNAHQITMLKGFQPAQRQGFTAVMLEASGVTSFHRIHLDPYTKLLLTSCGEAFGALERLQAEGHSIDEAIHRLMGEGRP